jgi:hypothetical protein
MCDPIASQDEHETNEREGGRFRMSRQNFTVVALFISLTHGTVSAQAEPKVSPLEAAAPGQEIRELSVVQVLDKIGRTTGVKFAVHDRTISRNGQPARELSSTIVSLDLAPGSCQRQLEHLGRRVPFLTWVEDGGVIWIVNKQASSDSPLAIRVETMDYYGSIYGLGSIVPNRNGSFSDHYLFDDVSRHWSDYSVRIRLTNVAVRTAYSAALTQLPAVGALMEFYEAAPADVFSWAAAPDNLKRGKLYFFWRMLKDPTLTEHASGN